MTTNAVNPVPAVDRRRIEDALALWFAATTGLGLDRINWTSTSEIVRSSFPLGTMQWLATATEGHDSLVVEDLGNLPTGTPDIRLHARGTRRVTISLAVFDDVSGVGPPPDASPVARLEAATARLRLPSLRRGLINAGFGVVSISGSREVAPGHVVAELVGYVASDVAEEVFSIAQVGFIPAADLDIIGPFTAGATVGAPTIYFGSSAGPVVTSADVLALSSSTPLAGVPTSLSVFAGPAAYSWIWIPSIAGVTTFTIDGFVGGYINTGSVVVDGVDGEIWRSTLTSTGSYNVELS